ncbi:dienelactone hydrolase family protein [Streptomyces sp. NPDC050504]|uniref:dienelactone hydrolase family protein n=1 Tax=Streptomyces sp. NPDC050504 TaxID=3365618 RepID=UPI00379355A2
MTTSRPRPLSLLAATTALALSATSFAPVASAAPSAPGAPMTTSGRSFLTGYRLAPGLLKITHDRKGGNPSQVHGVLGMPRGQGPRPVVVVLHGLHPNCVTVGRTPGVARRVVKTRWPLVCADPKKPKATPGVGPDYLRNDVGLSYMVQSLTRKGFVAVSIDVLSPEVWWGGETDPEKGYTKLVDAHLRLLADLNRGIDHGLRIKGVRGRIDTSRVGLVGHSRGGGYVLGPKAAGRAGLFGAVAVEPAVGGEPATHRVPVLNIRGACDEDTGSDAGRDTMKALAKSRRTGVAADVLVAGTGHRMLNSNLVSTRDDDGRLGGCRAARIAKPVVARAQVAQLTAAFLCDALFKARTYRLPALNGAAPKGGNLRKGGPVVTFVRTDRQTYTRPERIPELVSTRRILPAIPKNLRINKNPDGDI